LKYGVDLLNPPTFQQAQAIRQFGWSWCAVYVGGPRAAAHHIWQENAIDGYHPVKALASIFDGFLPIYVGANQPWDPPQSFTYGAGLSDGDDANACTGACGFDSDTPLCLDVEYGTWQANPSGVEDYIRGWVERVNAAGHRAGLYADIETLNQYVNRPDLIDFLWGAAWVRGNFSRAPVGSFDPQSPPPWDAWQWGGGSLANLSVDFNSMIDSFELARYG
jgi:Domain of unknown function (DUF1906)